MKDPVERWVFAKTGQDALSHRYCSLEHLAYMSEN
jgi:hypothetical protein